MLLSPTNHTVHNSCEKRWQCLSAISATNDGRAYVMTAEESRAIFQSTMKVCRLLPVGLTAEAAAKVLRLEGAMPVAVRWKLD